MLFVHTVRSKCVTIRVKLWSEYIDGGHDIIDEVEGIYYGTVILPNEFFKAIIWFNTPCENITSIELIDPYGVKVLKVG